MRWEQLELPEELDLRTYLLADATNEEDEQEEVPAPDTVAA